MFLNIGSTVVGVVSVRVTMVSSTDERGGITDGAGRGPMVKRDGGYMDAEFWRRDVSGFSWVIGEFRQLT